MAATVKPAVPPVKVINTAVGLEGDAGSSSDNDELPALVSAAIRRVESFESDSEATRNLPTTATAITMPVQYTSSLLRDFMAKTQQLLGKQELNEISVPEEEIAGSCSQKKPAGVEVLPKTETTVVEELVPVKRKRGRPKKVVVDGAGVVGPIPTKTDKISSRLKMITSDSPDSGILSISHSPTNNSPRLPNHRKSVAGRSAGPALVKSRSNSVPKINITNLEKTIYATERVLYPPRNVRRGRPPLNKNKQLKPPDPPPVPVDPIWKKIDITKKFRRPSTNGYKSDCGGVSGGPSVVVCSKVLAAQCGYTSDYGSVRKNRNQSGYRSDYSTKSRKSGYRSDYSVKGDACGYKSDCSVRHRKKVRRKRRTKSIHISGSNSSRQKPVITEQDILQLAGLSLGNSSEEEVGPGKVNKVPEQSTTSLLSNLQPFSLSKRVDFGQKNQLNRFATISGNYAKFSKSDFDKELINNLKMLNNNNSIRLSSPASTISSKADVSSTNTKPKTKQPIITKADIENFNHFDSNVLPLLDLQMKQKGGMGRSASIRSRRSSAVSRCSSRSTSSRHPFRRHRRRKTKTRSLPSIAKSGEEDKYQDIDELVTKFSESCKIIEIRRGVTEVVENKEKDTPKTAHKRVTKKRKGSENADQNPAGKRRNKKLQSTQSPDDHKLPLKKRHYLLTPGEKGDKEPKENVEEIDQEDVPLTERKLEAKSSKYNDNEAGTKQPQRAVTPKKRHLLEQKNLPQANNPVTSTPLKNLVDQLEKTADKSAVDHSPITPGRGKRLDSVAKKQLDAKRVDSKKLEITKKPENLSKKIEIKKMDIITKKMDIIKKDVLYKKRGPKPTPPTTPKTQSQGGAKDKKPSPIPPPGIFEPSVDLELQIPMSTITIPLSMKSSMKRSPLLSPLGKKKRRKVNRTGFPTAKKKKKFKLSTNLTDTDKSQLDTTSSLDDSIKCDRVPTEGEASDNFIERNRKPRLSVVSLERLQDPSLESPKRSLRLRDDSQEPKKRTRDESQESAKGSRAKKLKTEEAKDESKELSPTKLAKKRGRKKLSVIISEQEQRVAEEATERQNSILLDEMSLQKRQSIRNIAKSLMNEKEETVKMAEKVEKPPTLEQKRKRKMSMMVPREVREVTPVNIVPIEPVKEESPTAPKDIQPATTIVELEQEPLPIDDDVESIRTETPSSEISERTGRKIQRNKKKYLIAGLFSDYYKETYGEKSQKSFKDDQPPPPALLPPPPYCEKFFRQTEIDFQLPYDLWFAHENQKLPGRDTVASWNFKKIRTNVYIDIRPNPNTDQPSCSCKTQSNCGDDCLNRLVYSECSPDTCPCGERCQNTKIQKHEYSSGLERFMTENKGWGVRTKQAIQKSSFIIEYLGEVVTEREFKDRMASLYVRDTHHYCLHLDGELVIDGHRMGSDCRFVNHSCTPNCEMQKWSVNGLSRMCLFAMRDIRPGEELTYDYNFALYNPSEGQPCRCETEDCRGVIGGKSQRVVKPQEGNGSGKEDLTAVKSGRARKRQAKKNQCQMTAKIRATTPLFHVPTSKEQSIIRESHCFLMRNLLKVRMKKFYYF